MKITNHGNFVSISFLAESDVENFLLTSLRDTINYSKDNSGDYILCNKWNVCQSACPHKKIHKNHPNGSCGTPCNGSLQKEVTGSNCQKVTIDMLRIILPF